MDTANISKENTIDKPVDEPQATPAVVEPRFYEISYLIKTGLEDSQIVAIAESLGSLITDLNGIMVEEGRPKPMRLAYKINKQSDAYMGWIKFLLKHEQLNELEKSIGKIKEITRVRIIKTQKAVAKKPARIKKPLLTQKEDGAEDTEIDKKLDELLD